MHLLVYTEHITPRLTWILKEILGRRLGWEYLVVDDREAYRYGTSPGLTYAAAPAGRRQELVIPPAGLLYQTGVTPEPPRQGEVEGHPVLFPQPVAGAFPFDIFSAAFYMLSRYEEYLDFRPDAMGRFPAQESLAARSGWLDEPVVELWTALLAERIRRAFGGDTPRRTAAGRFIPTYDVDQAFAYRGKSFLRLAGGGMREKNLRERWRVWRGLEKDPFDTFEDIRKLHEGQASRPLLFFHAGGWGRYDKSISLEKENMQEVVRDVVGFAAVGVHPSVRSAKKTSLIASEKQHLERVAGISIDKSRMHYLMLYFPGIPRALLEAGIREDYTMGFPGMPGFRAGTCHPFNWYDLMREEETPLRFIPLTVMDGALRRGHGAAAGEVPDWLDHYHGKTEKYGGLFVTLWHNHTLAGVGAWAGWGKAYRRWVEKHFNS